MSARAYYVEGVEVVNTGGESCASCDIRPAVGRSISGLAVCQRCAAWAESESAGIAAEKELARERREARESERIARIGKRFPEIAERLARAADDMRERAIAVKRAATRFACGHDRTPENTYQNQRGRTACRECRRIQNVKNKRQARRREQLRLRRRDEQHGANPFFEAP